MIVIDFYVPACPPPTCPLTTSISLLSSEWKGDKCSAHKDEMEMASGICLEIAEDLREIWEGRSLKGLSPAVATSLSIVPTSLVTIQQGKQEQCGGGRWVQAGKALSCFSSSLFFIDS